MCLKNLGSLGDLCTSTIGLVYTHFIFIGSDVIVLYFIDISDRDELNFLFSSHVYVWVYFVFVIGINCTNEGMRVSDK